MLRIEASSAAGGASTRNQDSLELCITERLLIFANFIGNCADMVNAVGGELIAREYDPDDAEWGQWGWKGIALRQAKDCLNQVDDLRSIARRECLKKLGGPFGIVAPWKVSR